MNFVLVEKLGEGEEDSAGTSGDLDQFSAQLAELLAGGVPGSTERLFLDEIQRRFAAGNLAGVVGDLAFAISCSIPGISIECVCSWLCCNELPRQAPIILLLAAIECLLDPTRPDGNPLNDRQVITLIKTIVRLFENQSKTEPEVVRAARLVGLLCRDPTDPNHDRRGMEIAQAKLNALQSLRGAQN